MKLKFIITLFFLMPFLTGSMVRSKMPPLLPECLVKFTIHNAGMEVTGTVESVNVQIKFDPADLSQSTILATADPSTIKTGIAIRDKHLKRSDYFNVEKHPEIRFNSKSFRKAGQHKYIGQFDLAIKDVIKTITIPFAIRSDGETTHYKGTFEINRLDFNLGEKSALLDERVTVTIEVKMRE